MKTNKTHTAKEIIKAIASGQLAGLSLTADQLAPVKKHDGLTALHLAAIHGCLDQIKDGVTADQLAAAKDRAGNSALVYAAEKGCLNQVKGGVTAAQLKAQKNPGGGTGLLLAAHEGHLHQVQGDITAAELAADQLSDHTSALVGTAVHGQLDLLKGGVTAEQLAADRADDGNSALHAAAANRHLDQIEGGVTLDQMIAVTDGKGRTPLYWAARDGSLNQIKGGVTLEQMGSIKCCADRTALEVARDNHNLDQIPGADENTMDHSSWSKEEMVGLANMTCEGAVEYIGKGDKRVGYRMLLKLAMDLSSNGTVCAILAKTYVRLGDRKTGLKFARKAVKLIPEDSQAWRLLGHIYYMIGQLPEALAALQQAVEVDPNSAEALMLLAVIKSDLNHDTSVTEALSRRAVQADPANLHAWQWLAAHLEANGKSEESDQAHARYCELKLGDNAQWIRDANGTPMVALVKKGAELDLDESDLTELKSTDESATSETGPTLPEINLPEVMAEAASQQPDLAARVEAFEEKLVKAFGLPVKHRVAQPAGTASVKPAWLNNDHRHLIGYPDGVTADEVLRFRAFSLMQLQVTCECAQANGWAMVAMKPTPGFAREAYLKHGFGTVAKALVRAGHAEEAVQAAQQELIHDMTESMVGLVFDLLVEHRLARELPGLPPVGLPALAADWHEADSPQAPKAFYELAPQKITRRWKILQNAHALVIDGVNGTHCAEQAFANFDGAADAARIADYCRSAIGSMKPGDEVEIIREALRMARLQDFQSFQKLKVDLEQIRKGPADAGAADAVPAPGEPKSWWLNSLAEGQAELGRAAARVGPRKISGVRIHSANRHVILQGRNGETAAAGFFTWDAQAATDLPQLQETLAGQDVCTELITPDDGGNYWALITKFKPFARYSKKAKISVAVYLQEQIAALMEPGGHPFAKPVASPTHNQEPALVG